MNKKITAIILAAGEGTRMKSKDKNKVTLPFLNKPLIIYAVELMLQVAYPVIVVIGAFHKSVKQILKKYPVTYGYQQKRLGTGHAVKIGFQVIQRLSRPPALVLVCYGDHSMFYDKKTVDKLISLHLKAKAAVSLVTTEYKKPEKLRWGIIIRNKADNIIDSIEYKDANTYQREIKELNAGFYCFDFDFLKNNIAKIKRSGISGEYYINSLIKIAVKQGKRVVGLREPFAGVGIGINTYEELRESEKIYLKKMVYKILSIIIPVYNEEKYISEIVDRVIKADSLGLKKEIIVVNDGSTDATGSKVHKVIKFIKSIKAKVIIIDKQKNEGKGAALRDGFLKSTGDIVLVQDADLEYNPDDYPILLEPFLKNDADVVYGSRFISNRPHRILYFWHSLGNNLLTFLSNMFTNMNLTDMETGYKVFKGYLIRKIAKKLQSRRFGFEPEITARIAKIKNLKIFEVGISYWGRTYEEGKKIGWKDGLRALFEIIKYNLLVNE